MGALPSAATLAPALTPSFLMGGEASRVSVITFAVLLALMVVLYFLVNLWAPLRDHDRRQVAALAVPLVLAAGTWMVSRPLVYPQAQMARAVHVRQILETRGVTVVPARYALTRAWTDEYVLRAGVTNDSVLGVPVALQDSVILSRAEGRTITLMLQGVPAATAHARAIQERDPRDASVAMPIDTRFPAALVSLWHSAFLTETLGYGVLFATLGLLAGFFFTTFGLLGLQALRNRPLSSRATLGSLAVATSLVAVIVTVMGTQWQIRDSALETAHIFSPTGTLQATAIDAGSYALVRSVQGVDVIAGVPVPYTTQESATLSRQQLHAAEQVLATMPSHAAWDAWRQTRVALADAPQR